MMGSQLALGMSCSVASPPPLLSYRLSTLHAAVLSGSSASGTRGTVMESSAQSASQLWRAANTALLMHRCASMFMAST